MERDIETQRMKLWCDVVVAYVGASNSTHSSGSIVWADKILAEFDKRFKEQSK